MTETEQELYPSQQHHSPLQIEIDRRVRANVLNGIELLKREHGEDWWKKIDLDRLNLAHGSNCVLGQLYGGSYQHGTEALGIHYTDGPYGFSFHGVMDLAEELGVGYDGSAWPMLTAAWREEIEYLKEAQGA
jgi:hypothetical protein